MGRPGYGRALLSTDAREDPRFNASASVHELQLRSVVAIPLRLKGEVAGALGRRIDARVVSRDIYVQNYVE